jgi:hypothetical protein
MKFTVLNRLQDPEMKADVLWCKIDRNRLPRGFPILLILHFRFNFTFYIYIRKLGFDKGKAVKQIIIHIIIIGARWMINNANY